MESSSKPRLNYVGVGSIYFVSPFRSILIHHRLLFSLNSCFVLPNATPLLCLGLGPVETNWQSFPFVISSLEKNVYKLAFYGRYAQLKWCISVLRAFQELLWKIWSLPKQKGVCWNTFTSHFNTPIFCCEQNMTFGYCCEYSFTGSLPTYKQLRWACAPSFFPQF